MGHREHWPGSRQKQGWVIRNSVLYVLLQALLINVVLIQSSFLVLGVTEAGLFPGVIYVFSVYYRRHERSWRVAIFFGGAALAGAFGGKVLATKIMTFQPTISGILAYAIGKMNGIGGRKGWEWCIWQSS